MGYAPSSDDANLQFFPHKGTSSVDWAQYTPKPPE
jgi:hypothetical protein